MEEYHPLIAKSLNAVIEGKDLSCFFMGIKCFFLILKDDVEAIQSHLFFIKKHLKFLSQRNFDERHEDIFMQVLDILN